MLSERVPEELLIGSQGRFWTLTGQLEPLDVAAARLPLPAGRARAGWNFVTEPLPDGGTLLSTEPASSALTPPPAGGFSGIGA